MLVIIVFDRVYSKFLHLHHNGVCLRLRLASAPRPSPYFWS